MEVFWIIGIFTLLLPIQAWWGLLAVCMIFMIIATVQHKSSIKSLILLSLSLGGLIAGIFFIENHQERFQANQDSLNQDTLSVTVIRPTKDFGYQSLTVVQVEPTGEKVGLLHGHSGLPIGNTLTVYGEAKQINPTEPISQYIKSLDISGLYQGAIIESQTHPQNLHSSIWKHIDYLRKYLDTRTQEILPGNSGAFTAGILFGIDERLTDQRQEIFRTIGVTHILAISGSNVVLIIVLFQAILQQIPYLGRKRRFIITLIAIALFIILTGAEGSIIRAGLFAMIILTSIELGRLRQATRALIHTTVLISIFYPFTILYDVGFQLSILASLGLIWGTTYAKYIPTFFGKLIWETFCAQLFVLPLLIWTFGGFSLISFLANIIIIPIIPIAMILGVVILFPYLDSIAFITDSLNQTVFRISDIFAQVPQAYWEAGDNRLIGTIIAAAFTSSILIIFQITPKLYKVYINR